MRGESWRSVGWLWILLACGAAVPALALRLSLFSLGDPGTAVVFGGAIVAAAFLLSWAAEVAQLDFSQGLALALLALIAVLPEYVVDATLAWLAAEEPSYASYALANMTGANRLLIGLGWPLVVVIAFLRFGRRHVELEEGHGRELTVLLAATLYAFLLPLKGTLALVDFAFLFLLFAGYMVLVARLPAEQPHLVGPASLIGALPPIWRRLTTAAIGVGATVTILLVAKPFAKALVATGARLGIDEFLLVQWLAPLASEAPEFVVVALFAWRGQTTPAMGTLVSSKINQWTLLVAMLPVVYSLAQGEPDALPLDARQRDEVLLTAMQSLFALTLMLDLRLSLIGAGTLFGLFSIQVIWPETRGVVTVIYGLLSVVALILSRRHLIKAFRWLRKSP